MTISTLINESIGFINRDLKTDNLKHVKLA